MQRKSHICTPGSVRECEAMNSHTSKWTPTLGIRVPMEFRIFKEGFQGSKFTGLKKFIMPLKSSSNIDV
jgi:hypothetical protein